MYSLCKFDQGVAFRASQFIWICRYATCEITAHMQNQDVCTLWHCNHPAEGLQELVVRCACRDFLFTFLTWFCAAETIFDICVHKHAYPPRYICPKWHRSRTSKGLAVVVWFGLLSLIPGTGRRKRKVNMCTAWKRNQSLSSMPQQIYHCKQ